MLNKNITSLENIEFLGSSLIVENSNLSSFGNLEIIDGTLTLEDDSSKCLIESLENIRKIRKLVINSKTLQDLGALEEAKDIVLSRKSSTIIRRKLENCFIKTGKRYIIRDTIKIDV